ncbi:membrane protein insertase YidC [Bacillus sp. MRMR6]|uniref:membrane protein insertase YidC n=1 Tax=Bacillus sp. MRMR6 TaxID=1928617 RepID=UPI0009531A72|nr:membrane protein insertase YidC [Bacillus sp. MRMR6]OLS34378.1 OxaA precursor [Bacillus sp. MRMR6]
MKNKGSYKILILLTLAATLLSGCSTQNGSSDGFFHTYFIEPFIVSIHFFGEFFNGNYGLSIIFVTLIIRLILLPLMLKQYKNQMDMKEKMDVLKPELEEIQNKLKTETVTKKKQELQQEMMGLYKKHGVNPLNMGCLPILIQMPILTGFYYAIRGSEEIATHQFLWFNLGHPDIVITIIAGLVYYIQFKVSQTSMPLQQQQQMKFMGLLSPLMIVMFSMSAPAALPLYWSVGGAFLILQTLISRRLYRRNTEVIKMEAKPQ